MDLNSQNLCQKPGWQQAREVETGRCQEHLATQPSWVSESRGTVMRLHLKSQGGRYLQNSTWGCRIAPEVDLWPSHALTHVMIKTDPSPYSLEETEIAPSLPIKIRQGVSSGGKRRKGILWLGGSSFKVTVVKNNTANSQSLHMGHRGHPWLRLQFLQKETSVCWCCANVC